MGNGNSNFLVCFSLGICFMLLLSPTNAENKTEPRRNANLSPFESWRSAYFCLKNTSWTCAKDNILTLNGTLVVKAWQIFDYCNGGCYQHTLNVIKCIHDVKRNAFKFENKAPLSFLKDAIVKACSEVTSANTTDLKALNVTYKDPNSATSLYGRLYMPLVSTLTTLAFLATFNV